MIILPGVWLKSTWNPLLGIVFVEVFATKIVLQGGVVDPTPNLQPGRPGSLLVWPLPFDLSGMSGPTRSTKLPVGIALQVIETRKPPHQAKVVTLRDVRYSVGTCIIISIFYLTT